MRNICILSIALLVSFQMGFGQVINCSDLTFISLGYDGTTEITPEMILEGNVDDYDTLWVEPNIVDCSMLDEPILVTLYTSLSNSCWGEADISDKMKPEITVQQYQKVRV